MTLEEQLADVGLLPPNFLCLRPEQDVPGLIFYEATKGPRYTWHVIKGTSVHWRWLKRFGL